MERIQHIKEKLEAIGSDYDSQKTFIKQYLEEIEVYIEDQVAKQNEVVAVLQEASLTLVAVSNALGYSRTTLYNNPVLKQYIEYSAELLAHSNPITQKDKIMRQKQDTEKRIQLMEMREFKMNNSIMNVKF